MRETTAHRDRRGRGALLGAGVAALLLGPALLAPPAGAAPPTPTFRAREALSLTGALWLVPADLDDDGLDDLVVTSGSGATAQVRIAMAGADGYGAFSSVPIAAPGQAPEPVVADLDDDGDLDLLLPLAANGTQTMLGNGDGTFAPAVAGTAQLTRAAVGELTGDGVPDLVAQDGTGLRIYEGDGSGAFAPTDVLLPEAGLLRDLAVADLDADGSDDVVAVAWSGNPLDPAMPSTVSAHHSVGDGTFDQPTDRTQTGSYHALAIGDLDEDGLLDVAVATTSSLAGAVLSFGQADGSIGELSEVGTGDASRQVDLADVDEDGHLDLIIDGANASLAFGRGDGTFERAVGYRAGRSATEVRAADVDGDGDLDLVALSTASPPVGSSVTVLRNRGDARFDGVAGSPRASTSADALGDVDGDGHLDYVVTKAAATGEAEVFRNDGRGRLGASEPVDLPFRPTALTVGPVGADDRADLVGVSGSSLVVARSLADGSFASTTYALGALRSVPPVVADLDGDGDGDVAVIDSLGNAKVLLASATGALGASTSVALGVAAEALEAADLDGDGRTDLVATGSSGPVSSVLGTGGGSFGAPITSATGVAPTWFTVGDLDGDGLPDAVVSAGAGSTSRVVPLLGTGTGSFVAGAPVTPSEHPFTGSRSVIGVSIGDVNQDGHGDVALDGIRMLVSDCAGRLSDSGATGTQYESPYYRTHLTDIDGDAVPDVVGGSSDGAVVVRSPLPGAGPDQTAAPFRSCRHLVRQVVRDLAQRTPSSAEVQLAAEQLADGAVGRGEVAASIRASDDHATNVDPVVRLYRAYFLRNPDPGGLDYWVAKRRAGATLSSVSTSFARSSEFQRRYGSLTSLQFVDLVYLNVLGRPGEASGVSYWTRQLDTGRRSRGQVMLNFSESNEYRTKQTSEVHAAVLLTWMLRQRPPTAAFDAAVAALDGGASVGSVAEDVLDLPAYAARVGQS